MINTLSVVELPRNSSGGFPSRAPGYGAQVPANQPTVWPPNRPRSSGHLRLVPVVPATADEVRGLIRNGLGVAARVHPMGRWLNVLLLVAENAFPPGDNPEDLPYTQGGLVAPAGSWVLQWNGPCSIPSLYTVPGLVGGNYNGCGRWTQQLNDPSWNGYDTNGVPASAWSFSQVLRNPANMANFYPVSTWRTTTEPEQPMSSIVIIPGPAVRYETSQPVYPVTWTPPLNAPQVAHRVVAQVNRWREWITPRPDGKPLRENPLPRPRPEPETPPPVPAVGSAVAIQVGQPPRPGQGHQYRPPRRGERERKVTTTPGIAQAILAAASQATEINDIIEAIWWALPPEHRTPNASPTQMLQDIYAGMDDIDAAQAVKNIVLTQVWDTAIGMSSAPLQRAFREYFPDRQFPFFGPI